MFPYNRPFVTISCLDFGNSELSTLLYAMYSVYSLLYPFFRPRLFISGKSYKTKGGYERHGTAKHGNTESESATMFTTSLLAEMVNSAVQSIKERKVFNLSIKNELTVFIFELEERSDEFFYLKTIYESLRRKGDVEKFYSNFYGTVALNATKYFKGLTRNAATLLATKVADTMIANSKKQKLSSVSNESIHELTDKQKAGLQYVSGYVLQNLQRNIVKLTLLKANKR